MRKIKYSVLSFALATVLFASSCTTLLNGSFSIDFMTEEQKANGKKSGVDSNINYDPDYIFSYGDEVNLKGGVGGYNLSTTVGGSKYESEYPNAFYIPETLAVEPDFLIGFELLDFVENRYFVYCYQTFPYTAETRKKIESSKKDVKSVNFGEEEEIEKHIDDTKLYTIFAVNDYTKPDGKGYVEILRFVSSPSDGPSSVTATQFASTSSPGNTSTAEALYYGLYFNGDIVGIKKSAMMKFAKGVLAGTRKTSEEPLKKGVEFNVDISRELGQQIARSEFTQNSNVKVGFTYSVQDMSFYWNPDSDEYRVELEIYAVPDTEDEKILEQVEASEMSLGISIKKVPNFYVYSNINEYTKKSPEFRDAVMLLENMPFSDMGSVAVEEDGSPMRILQIHNEAIANADRGFWWYTDVEAPEISQEDVEQKKNADETEMAEDDKDVTDIGDVNSIFSGLHPYSVVSEYTGQVPSGGEGTVKLYAQPKESMRLNWDCIYGYHSLWYWYYHVHYYRTIYIEMQNPVFVKLYSVKTPKPSADTYTFDKSKFLFEDYDASYGNTGGKYRITYNKVSVDGKPDSSTVKSFSASEMKEVPSIFESRIIDNKLYVYSIWKDKMYITDMSAAGSMQNNTYKIDLFDLMKDKVNSKRQIESQMDVKWKSTDYYEKNGGDFGKYVSKDGQLSYTEYVNIEKRRAEMAGKKIDEDELSVDEGKEWVCTFSAQGMIFYDADGQLIEDENLTYDNCIEVMAYREADRAKAVSHTFDDKRIIENWDVLEPVIKENLFWNYKIELTENSGYVKILTLQGKELLKFNYIPSQINKISHVGIESFVWDSIVKRLAELADQTPEETSEDVEGSPERYYSMNMTRMNFYNNSLSKSDCFVSTTPLNGLVTMNINNPESAFIPTFLKNEVYQVKVGEEVQYFYDYTYLEEGISPYAVYDNPGDPDGFDYFFLGYDKSGAVYSEKDIVQAKIIPFKVMEENDTYKAYTGENAVYLLKDCIDRNKYPGQQKPGEDKKPEKKWEDPENPDPNPHDPYGPGGPGGPGGDPDPNPPDPPGNPDPPGPGPGPNPNPPSEEPGGPKEEPSEKPNPKEDPDDDGPGGGGGGGEEPNPDEKDKDKDKGKDKGNGGDNGGGGNGDNGGNGGNGSGDDGSGGNGSGKDSSNGDEDGLGNGDEDGLGNDEDGLGDGDGIGGKTGKHGNIVYPESYNGNGNPFGAGGGKGGLSETAKLILLIILIAVALVIIIGGVVYYIRKKKGLPVPFMKFNGNSRKRK